MCAGDTWGLGNGRLEWLGEVVLDWMSEEIVVLVVGVVRVVRGEMGLERRGRGEGVRRRWVVCRGFWGKVVGATVRVGCFTDCTL